MSDLSRPLAGRIAMVTGASRGIGRAIAGKLARAGCDLAVVYHSSHDQAEAAVREAQALGVRAVAIQGNVASPESLDEVFAAFRSHFDRLDLLISNAASGVLKPAVELTLKHWRWCLETNALALNLLVQRALPLLPSGARVIALSSLGAQRAMPEYAFIGASKAALEALVRSLARELGPRGVRVNAVSAGVVDTDALQAFPHREEMRAEFARRSPAGRVLEPADVAGAVYLLALPEAEMISGHTLVVDGGYSVSG